MGQPFIFEVLVPWRALNSCNVPTRTKPSRRSGGLAQLSDSSTGYHGYIDTQVRTGSSISIAAKAGQSPHSPIGVLGSFCAKGDTRQAAFSFRRARVAAYCVAIVSQARAATMLESDVVTGIFDAGQGVRRLQSARLSHDNHETKRRRRGP